MGHAMFSLQGLGFVGLSLAVAVSASTEHTSELDSGIHGYGLSSETLGVGTTGNLLKCRPVPITAVPGLCVRARLLEVQVGM